MAGARAQVYCLDASACALGSEDYTATTRWHFQRELVTVHSGAAARQPSAGVALVAAAAGRASVALHPTTDAEALQAALHQVQPAGEASLEAALKLALLVSHRFPAGRTHVTAFVASSGAAASLAQHPAAATELRQRFADSAVGLDVAVLCTSDELGAECTAALAALTGAEAAAASSDSGSGAKADGPTPASTARLLWLSPVDTAAESWQQLEPALEQLESGARRSDNISAASSSRGASGGSISTGGGSEQSALPRRISRAPRQAPPTSLLAARSGVQQPALCRGESLSRFGHLSSDGMARPWLPTYSSLGQAAKNAAATAAGAIGGTSEMCYVELQPLPGWRTLLKVAAGRMLPAPAAGSRPGSGNYASASSQLLRSLEALSILDDEPEGSAGSSAGSQDGNAGSSEDSGSSEAASGAGSGPGSSGDSSPVAAAAAAAPPSAVRYVPDSTRGTLRLLQSTKEPRLKLVWSADRGSSAARGAAASSAQVEGQQQQQQQQRQQPLDMFGSAAATGSSGRGASAARAPHLAHLPAATAAASAARGPILREGCELWEDASQFDFELSLPTSEGGNSTGGGGTCSGSGSSSAGIPASTFEARQLPNGAQLLMVSASSPGSRGSSGSGVCSTSVRGAKSAAAFWLQQHVGPDSLQAPAYGTALSSQVPSEAATAAAAAAARAASPSGAEPEAAQPPQPEQQQEAGEAGAGPAAVLAAALQRLLRQPPAVDLRRLRRDVKSGAIEITAVTVGPLPTQIVRDIVNARSALMTSMGKQNLDSWHSWGEGPSNNAQPSGPSSGAQPAGGSAAGGAAGASSGSSGTMAEAAGTGGGDSTSGSGSNEQDDRGAALRPAGVALQQHRSEVLSLLRQRLSKLPGSKPSGSGGGSSSAATEAPAPLASPPGDADEASTAAAVAEEGAGTLGQANATTPPTAARPCSPPMATPAPPTTGSCSSSMADTPFGTPMAILPSCLLHPSSGGAPAEDAAGSGGGAAAGAAVGALPDHGLPSEGGHLLDSKPEGSVLVGAPSQGDAGDHSEHTLFQIE